MKHTYWLIFSINIDYKAICLPTYTKIYVKACEGSQCVDLGCASSDDKNLQVRAYAALTSGGPYTIFLKTEDGYVEDCTSSFTIGASKCY